MGKMTKGELIETIQNISNKIKRLEEGLHELRGDAAGIVIDLENLPEAEEEIEEDEDS